jgi:hypothetical protein
MTCIVRKLQSLVFNQATYIFSEMASGGGKGRIPWARLQKAQGDYVLDEYLPTGVTLAQYHHIRLQDANSVLQHWTARQVAGQIAFRFKTVDDTSFWSKSAPREGNISADIGSGNGEKEDPDGARKVQAQGGGKRSAAEGEGDDTAEDPGPSRVSSQRRVIYPLVNFSIHSLAVNVVLVAQQLIKLPRNLESCRQMETVPIPPQLTRGPTTERKRIWTASERYRRREAMVKPREMASAQLPQEKEMMLLRTQVQAR